MASIVTGTKQPRLELYFTAVQFNMLKNARARLYQYAQKHNTPAPSRKAFIEFIIDNLNIETMDCQDVYAVNGNMDDLHYSYATVVDKRVMDKMRAVSCKLINYSISHKLPSISIYQIFFYAFIKYLHTEPADFFNYQLSLNS